jgi:hypothetical protein
MADQFSYPYKTTGKIVDTTFIKEWYQGKGKR